MALTAYDIIKRPIITEQSMEQTEMKRYTFEVAKDSNKVEIRQAIEMTSIYRDDIKGTRELFSSILDNRLNNAMKYLTSITLLMAVPTVISGLYGMNVQADGMPFANSTAGFAIVLGLTLALCILSAWVLHKKHML